MADSEFSRPSLPTLISQIRNDILSRFQQDEILRRTNAEVYSRATAAAVNSLYGYLDYLARNMLPDLADEAWLYRHGNLKKCPRKDPIASKGWARWDGVNDAIAVPSGTELQRDDQVTFVTTAAATVDGGVLRAPVECETPGAIGNTDDGTGLILVSPITGLSSRAVADTITGGDDIEDVEVWRARIIDRWWYIPQSGADQDYVTWAKSIDDVSRAWVFRNYQGAGTVGVMIATDSDTDPRPPQSLIDEAYNYIAPLSPVAGARLYVFGPTLKPIDFNITLYPDSTDTRNSVMSEVKAFLKRDGSPEGTLYLSRINEAISVAAGESHHVLISPAADIKLGDKELPTANTFTWTSQQ
ncbi:baseplate J/gp47 family protein [Enterobacter kobei]|uniref:baseplate J/gp47 family protein n=1 Tax=Enterobacter kobei TaxID=208224 RepID=UPI000792D0FC|nr:baseplate J/gp47 family protein [Enterobacter kobei]SAF46759.1 baseplate J family protein [Enterobacter kobei]